MAAPPHWSLSPSPQFDMQQLSLDELKQVLFHAFRDHLTMKDIENIIITEEESLNENSGNCPEYEGGERSLLFRIRSHTLLLRKHSNDPRLVSVGFISKLEAVTFSWKRACGKNQLQDHWNVSRNCERTLLITTDLTVKATGHTLSVNEC